MKEFEGKETAQIVDRYRFHDLFPCSPAELKSIGYSEVLAVSSKSKVELPIAAETADVEDEEEEKICRPDFSQMIPFKPKLEAYPGEHIVSGKRKLVQKLVTVALGLRQNVFYFILFRGYISDASSSCPRK